MLSYVCSVHCRIWNKIWKDNRVVLISIKKHLAELIKSFKEYFPSNDDIKKEDWIRNPFSIDHANFSCVEKPPIHFCQTERSFSCYHSQPHICARKVPQCCSKNVNRSPMTDSSWVLLSKILIMWAQQNRLISLINFFFVKFKFNLV